ncbi:MAG TPA: alpha/beta hydrolase-fold protein [Gammaproteobacteria bacterium]|jgi:enterochelin esterase-like enzyme
MAMKRAKWPGGRTVTLEHASKALADNALGDPSTRLIDIWLPPQYDQNHGRGRGRRFPVLFDLVGYAGSGRSHTNWRAFGDNVPEQAARLVHQNKLPPCIIVFPDCFTALGGNQYINSSAVGRYADYLTRELVPFVDREFRTQASREHRGCFGKSSGGYGAMIHGMRYARYWGAIAVHSGDAYFDFVYRADWPNTLNELAKHRRRKRRAGAIHVPAEELGADAGLDDGRVRRFLQAIWSKPSPSTAEVHCLMNLAMAASYDPDPDAPNGFRLPFNLETGELIEARWRNWLKHDPIRLVDRYRGNLKSLRGIFIDCGWRDQYHIHYGSRVLSKRLGQVGVVHRYEEFDDTHSGIDYRMDRSLPFLARALS